MLQAVIVITLQFLPHYWGKVHHSCKAAGKRSIFHYKVKGNRATNAGVIWISVTAKHMYSHASVNCDPAQTMRLPENLSHFYVIASLLAVHPMSCRSKFVLKKVKHHGSEMDESEVWSFACRTSVMFKSTDIR